jgi:hypothetical protein
LVALAIEKRVCGDKKRAGLTFSNGGKRHVDFAFAAGVVGARTR